MQGYNLHFHFRRFSVADEKSHTSEWSSRAKSSSDIWNPNASYSGTSKWELNHSLSLSLHQSWLHQCLIQKWVVFQNCCSHFNGNGHIELYGTDLTSCRHTVAHSHSCSCRKLELIVFQVQVVYRWEPVVAVHLSIPNPIQLVATPLLTTAVLGDKLWMFLCCCRCRYCELYLIFSRTISHCLHELCL